MYVCLSGQGRGSVQGAAREIAARWARLSIAALYSSDGPLSQDGSPRFYLIKSNSELVFPQGFFQGCLPESCVQMCLVSVLCFC
jgi:hypothetical protein